MSTGVKEYRSTGVQEYRSTGVQECRGTGVQEYRGTRVMDNIGIERHKRACTRFTVQCITCSVNKVAFLLIV